MLLIRLVRAVAGAVVLLVALAPAAAPAQTRMDMADHGRYLGTPDFALTSAMIAAGGGPAHFSAVRLTSVLFAQHAPAELASLQQRFGAARVKRYVATFDTFVDGAIGLAIAHHLALPPPDPALSRDPYELAASLRAAGVMPDGRFDIGYLIEHLISRPFHVTLMNRVNADPAIGPAVNADFHVIFTAEMNDLRQRYHLPR